ncbi:MAG: serine hydrolase domain-containing protein [Phaeodactylibacter xiamenensis]|uniref:serine hydrolase domain-containing protein n=1 Tax=Phaeodactylibacter xiamenensis TaxID=1524460 RepID=UPI000695EA49|nr:serine hydrolase domain-containing protein [Phaeodactylibacter xiamenensis]MCR9052709.1 beta-lactamase family protein [bacterium]
MKTILTATMMLSFLFPPKPGPAQRLKKAERKIEKLFQRELDKAKVHNAFLSVYAPGRGLQWTFTGGQFEDGSLVSPASPFHSASIGKTFTATLVMLLVEEGKLELDAPLSNYLPEDAYAGLHVWNGVDMTGQITIAQLLQHTSGLPDWFEDRPEQGMAFLERMLTEPNQFWTPQAILDYTRQNLKPHFPPGQGYYYTDTEYFLLGLIIERLYRQPLHEVLEAQILEPLQLTQTSMYFRSDPLDPYTGRMAELYADDMDISTFKSLSADWAGGGLLTTTDDLLQFMEALNTGKLINRSTYEAMQQWVPETRGMEYGYGLRKFRLRGLFPLLPDLTLIGHSGSTGSYMYYCPELEVYLAGTFNQTGYMKEHVVFMVKVLSVLKKQF